MKLFPWESMRPEVVQNILDSLQSKYICDWGYVEGELPSSYEQYDQWIKRGDHGPLHYLADHRKDIRSRLTSYYPSFKSALVFLFSYSAEKKALNNFYQTKESNGLKIASYALGFEGEDYHQVVQTELNFVGDKLKENHKDLELKLASDIHPVLDRDLAYRAGLGWFGRNSMLISPKEGSFCMIGALLIDHKLEITPRKLQTDHCGTCTACIQHCPTLAIDGERRQIKASRCISTFTIETFKEAPPIEGHKSKGSGEIFGCDICQDVCPWNRRPLQRASEISWPSSSQAKLIQDFFLTRSPKEIEIALTQMSKRKYKRVFKQTSLDRTGRDGMLKNIDLFSN